MKYFILNNEIALTQSYFDVFDSEEEATIAKTGNKTVIRNGVEIEEPNYTFETVVVPSDKNPELVQFEKVNNVWVDTERALTPEEIKAQQDWEGLEDDLELIELEDSPNQTFFFRAITTQNQNAYALLLNCFGANKWDARLGPALQMVKEALPVALSANELAQLNTILSNRGFQITIT